MPESGADYQCVTHPFAVGLNPLDLHALDTPPAFILSQDQTLKYDTAFIVFKFQEMENKEWTAVISPTFFGFACAKPDLLKN